ncbi:MAG: hypothetical protein RIG62_22170 [Cyclobacteriaceae bacterium]
MMTAQEADKLLGATLEEADTILERLGWQEVAQKQIPPKALTMKGYLRGEDQLRVVAKISEQAHRASTVIRIDVKRLPQGWINTFQHPTAAHLNEPSWLSFVSTNTT